VLNIILGAMILVSLLAAIAAPWLVRHLIAPGFDASLQALTADLLRIVLISSTLFAVSSLVMSILQAYQHFALPALADFFYDVGIIIGALLLVPSMGIYGLALGVVIGAALHLLIQVPGLIHYRARYVFTLRTGDRSLLELGRLMGPRILILGMFQLVFLFTLRLASYLEEGSIAAISMGWTIMQMPEVIFAMAIAIAAFPTMSRLVAQGRREDLKGVVSNALRAILFLILPSTVALLLLGRAYITVLFARGAFDQRAVDMVYAATVAFTVGLLGHSILEVAARIHYAHKNTVTPFWIALGATALNVALCILLARTAGHAGLALANSIAVTLQAGILLWLGWRLRVRFDWRRVWGLTWRAVLASAAMAASILMVAWGLESRGTLWLALFGTIVGGTVYLGTMALLSRGEFLSLIHVALRRSTEGLGD
jgi:putative peptidoglycan lipid II flippase